MSDKLGSIHTTSADIVERVRGALEHGLSLEDCELAITSYVEVYAADNARLRELIKHAEWLGYEPEPYDTGQDACPWCEATQHTNWTRDESVYPPKAVCHTVRKHKPNCPAFTVDGVVK